MEETYTFTARSAVKPEKVMTFTLHDHRMTVDVGAPLEHIERALASAAEGQEGEEEAPEEGVAAHPEAWLKPTTVSLMGRLGRP